jgi:hypothetical protein
MLKLIRGMQEKLKGNVIVYSHLTNPEAVKLAGAKPMFSLYGSTDLQTFAKKLSLGKSEIQTLRENELKTIRDANKNGEKLKVFFNYVSPIVFSSLEELMDGKEDIIHAGDYLALPSCFNASKMGIEMYFLKLENQIIIEKQSPDSFREKEDSLETIESYNSIKKGQLKNYLRQTFVAPLMSHTPDEAVFGDLSSNLKKFCKGSNFMADIEEIVNLLGSGKMTPSLAEDYLSKVEAIYEENYLRAALFRDKIKKRI